MTEMPRLSNEQEDAIWSKNVPDIPLTIRVKMALIEIAQSQRELLENYMELPTQEQLERDLDVLIVFKNGDVDIPLTAERIINYLRGKE